MILRKYKTIIKDEIDRVLNDNKYPKIEYQIKEIANPEFGQLYTNIPFILSRIIKKNPIDIANNIGKNIKFSNAINVSISKPGYLNFKIDHNNLFYEVLSKNDKNIKESLNIGKGEKIIIEHTSVNPNKALHIGHARNLFIGDTLGRMMEYTGHNITIMNYVDDSGLQVADIIVGLKYGGFNEKPEEKIKFDEYAGDEIYIKINQLYETNSELIEKRKFILKELEKKSEIREYAKKITRKILEGQLKTAKRLRAKYDVLVFESDIIFSDGWNKIFEKMKENKIIKYEKEGKLKGTWIIKTSFKNETDKVIIRSDGTSTYIAKDIVLAAWKIGILDEIFNYIKLDNENNILSTTQEKTKNNILLNNNSKAITIIDARQNRLQKIIKEILNKLNDNKNTFYEHLSYEVVSLSRDTAIMLGLEINDKKNIQMSGRKGNYINVDNALDKIKTRVFEETKLRNSNETNDWINSTSEKIAISAFRYELLKNDLDKMITFDLNNSLRLDGETGPYLLYTYARASRILEKAKTTPKLNKNVSKFLKLQHEIDLIYSMSKIDLVIEDAVLNMSPMRIAKFTYAFCNQFNSFYEKSSVLHENNIDVKNSRLCLVHSFKMSLELLLDLLGIEKLERI